MQAKESAASRLGEIFDSTALAEIKHNARKGSLRHAANVNNHSHKAAALPDGTKLHWKYEENEE